MGRSVGRLVGRSVSRPVGLSICRSVGRSVGRSAGWPVGRWAGRPDAVAAIKGRRLINSEAFLRRLEGRQTPTQVPRIAGRLPLPRQPAARSISRGRSVGGSIGRSTHRSPVALYGRSRRTNVYFYLESDRGFHRHKTVCLAEIYVKAVLCRIFLDIAVLCSPGAAPTAPVFTVLGRRCLVRGARSTAPDTQFRTVDSSHNNNIIIIATRNSRNCAFTIIL